MVHHPDKNIDDPEAGNRFKEIAAAYEILSDPDTRQLYDERGLAGLAGGSSSGFDGMDPSDFFAEFFGSGGFSFSFDSTGSGGGRSRRDRNSTIMHSVTLEDLYNGKSVKMNLEKEIVCAACHGSGGKNGAKLKSCFKCEGKGWTILTTPMGGSVFGQQRVRCDECEGEGQKIREKDRCKKCKGKKTVKEKKRHELLIEKGMRDGSQIVLHGEGDQSPDTTPGDVVFVLKMERHPAFERAGEDLLAKVTITLSEALLGFDRILLTHLDGRGIRLDGASKKIIRPQDTVRIPHEGMPKYRNTDIKGDLYVVFDVEFPEDSWLKSVDATALEALLPPKRVDLQVRPDVVDTVEFEKADSVDFGADEDEDAWTDDEEDEEPECRHQ